MADTLTRLEPVEGAPFEAPGVTIAVAGPASRHSVRSRDSALIERVLDTRVPTAIGETIGGVMRLGPDELFVLGPPGRSIESPAQEPVSITDISDRSVGFTIEGPRSIDVLSAGCPLDLQKLATGRAVRTIYETVEVIIFRQQPELFRVEVWRSFAPWLWLALCTAASEA